MEQMRLNKYLARCGVCSRRDADKLIERGGVLVNGQSGQAGQLVSGEDEILVSGRRVQGVRETVVLAFYKPFGVTCTERDSHAERIVSDVVDYPIRVTYAGRLDKDSEGLLLLSNDGDLIQAMMKGANRHEKEYLVRVNHEITPEFLGKMSKGVYLEELDITTRECRVEQGAWLRGYREAVPGLRFAVTGDRRAWPPTEDWRFSAGGKRRKRSDVSGIIELEE